MSVDTGSLAWGLLRRRVFSIVLIAAAGCVAFKGVQFSVAGMETRSAFPALLANYPTPPQQKEVVATREEIGAWRDSWGLRDIARASYFDIGRTLLRPPPSDVVKEAAEVLAVAPLRGVTWVDFASFAWHRRDLRELVLDAWNLSGIAAPYEVDAIVNRLNFLSAYWPNAGTGDKQRFFREATLLLASPGGTNQWRTIMFALPVERRTQIESEFKAFSPRYRPVR